MAVVTPPDGSADAEKDTRETNGEEVVEEGGEGLATTEVVRQLLPGARTVVHRLLVLRLPLLVPTCERREGRKGFCGENDGVEEECRERRWLQLWDKRPSCNGNGSSINGGEVILW